MKIASPDQVARSSFPPGPFCLSSCSRTRGIPSRSRKVVVNLRERFSDARFWRHPSVPSVVYRVGGHHMGGTDEHATVDDLDAVFAVHAFAAFDYLHGR